MRHGDDMDRVGRRMVQPAELLGQQHAVLAVVVVEQAGMRDRQQRDAGDRQVQEREQERFVAGLVVGVVAGRCGGKPQRGPGVVVQVVDRCQGQVGGQADPRQASPQRGAQVQQRHCVGRQGRRRGVGRAEGVGPGEWRRGPWGKVEVHAQALQDRAVAVS